MILYIFNILDECLNILDKILFDIFYLVQLCSWNDYLRNRPLVCWLRLRKSDSWRISRANKHALTQHFRQHKKIIR